MPTCPKCQYEPRDRLLSSPCPNPECGYIFWDTEDYVRMLADGLDVRSFLDVGCGNKGIIGQAYWDEIGVELGYACDRHVVKPPPAGRPYIAKRCDVESLTVTTGKVDFVTHCGLLEHIEYAKAFRVLRRIEELARKRVFSTCSAFLREVDYKVRHDGNPYHYYRSWWDARTFELLGYTVDRERMKAGLTFFQETTYWYDPDKLPAGSWEERFEAAKANIRARRCCGSDAVTKAGEQIHMLRVGDDISGVDDAGKIVDVPADLARVAPCSATPIFWDASQDGDHHYCLHHTKARILADGNLDRWLERGDVEKHAVVDLAL